MHSAYSVVTIIEERGIETQTAVVDTHVGDGLLVSLVSMSGTNSNSCLPLTASAPTAGGERELNDNYRGSFQKEVIIRVKQFFVKRDIGVYIYD